MRGPVVFLLANILLTVPGLCFIGYGIYLLSGDRFFNCILRKGKPWDSDYILMGSGAFILFSAVFRCIGVFKLNRRLIFSSIILTVLTCIAGLVLMILVFGFYYQPKPYALKAVKEAIKEEYGEKMEGNRAETRQTSAIDDIQKEFKCCGVDGYIDWKGSSWSSKNELRVPKSCCNTTDYKACQDPSGPAMDIYPKGCSKELQDWAAKYIPLMGGLGCATLVLSFIGGILTVFAWKSMR